ncbi:RHS repeat-associated core domain-containing protein [Streptomyces sp. SGAir0957]
MTQVGTREYDPSTGQFLSVDSLLMPDQHQSLNGYGYANSTPTTVADPSGLGVVGCHTGEISCTGGRPDTAAEIKAKGKKPNKEKPAPGAPLTSTRTAALVPLHRARRATRATSSRSSSPTTRSQRRSAATSDGGVRS